MKTLLELAVEHQTDKEWYHGYISGCYARFFEPLRSDPVRLLEIGIFKGDSIRMWREYFTNPKASITGVDIRLPEDLPAGPHPNNVHILEDDAYSLEFVQQLPQYDIIIDDGPHTHDSQVTFLSLYYDRVAPGGLLICEDVASPTTRYQLREMRRPLFIMDKSTTAASDSYLMVWEKPHAS